MSTNQGQYTLSQIDNSASTPLTMGVNLMGLFAGDLILRSYWGVSVDLNDGNMGDNNTASNTRIPSTSSFTINSRNGNTFGTLFTVRNSGNVGIGTTVPDQKLTVNGTIHSREIIVDTQIPTPDYVFLPNYNLTDLTLLKEYLINYHHLPEIPSASQIEKDGLKLGQMNMLLLKKVEELTLYLIDKDREVKEQRAEDERLQSQIDQLKKLEQVNLSQQKEIQDLKQRIDILLAKLDKKPLN